MSPGPIPRLIAYYVALFAASGLLLPYLPVHFLAMGFSGAQVAALSAVGAVGTMTMPPVWGYLADRSGRPAALLGVATTGWALALSLQLGVQSFGQAAAAAAATAVFGASLSSLADSLATAAAREAGVEYARVRLWGSVAFALSSLGFGQALARGVSPSKVVPLAVGAAAVAAALGWAAPRGLAAGGARPSLGDVRQLLGQRELRLFLAAAALHWASFSPFTLFLAPHLERATGSQAFVGPSVALAVGAEVAGMRLYSALRRRAELLPLLRAAFAVNVVRWGAMAGLSSGSLGLSLQLLHGLSFGVFFVGSVEFLEKSVPAPLRSTGRALFGAAAFGLGGMGGHTLAGWVFDRVGTRGAFAVGAAVEVVALLLLLLLR